MHPENIYGDIFFPLNEAAHVRSGGWDNERPMTSGEAAGHVRLDSSYQLGLLSARVTFLIRVQQAERIHSVSSQTALTISADYFLIRSLKSLIN